jgi:hypothetical protein
MRAFCLAGCLAVLAGSAAAQQSSSDEAYVARVMKAAPPQIVQDATIIKMDGNEM